jgi:Beta-lactamase enzyme family
LTRKPSRRAIAPLGLAALLALLLLAPPIGGKPSGRTASSSPGGGGRLAIRRQGAQLHAVFRLRARADTRAGLVVRLYAQRPHPDAGWRRIRRWLLIRTLPDARPYELRVTARGARATCRRYAACRLRATATSWLPGEPAVRLRAQRPVATGLWEPPIAAARRYARGRLGDVSFAVVDLRSRLRSFEGARTAPAASVIKAMLLVAYLRQRSVRSRALREDERALLEPMIRVSDNAAGIRVAALLGGDRVERLARAARMRDFDWVWAPGWLGGQSQISARDQARFFHRFDRYVPVRHRRFARRLLGSVVSWQRWGIGTAQPRGWRLYFKGGWGIEDDGIGTVNHQVAFLERGRCRLALAVLTEHDPSPGYGTETLEGVSRRLLHGVAAAPCGRSTSRRRGYAGASILGKSGGTRSTP